MPEVTDQPVTPQPPKRAASEVGEKCGVTVPTYKRDGDPASGHDDKPCEGIVHQDESTGRKTCDARGHRHA